MSASLNTIENPPVAEPVQSDEEDIVDVTALAQQLKDAELRNERIAKKKQERADAKRLKEEKDEADRLAREEAERKIAKVNKKKRVSAI